MHIILTHEQADFDALASLLGAHLLDESTVPVLPRRMNRNVSAFLTLYGAELPFQDPRDLTGGPVEAVTLVDTQSMISLKGMSSKTRVHVIDHHPLREDLPESWSVTVAGTGANTTIFIESLRERDTALSTVQATLLLLGIYEDTGSLTYNHTTARDLQAASFLLEQGASLHIARDFLNHPLTPGQQALYEQIYQNATHMHVHGHTLVIATGEATKLDEELSTVAHKLRDLLDPDALFVIVTTRGGVQIIARSTSDQIDVAEIVAHFGGGGHERAAAGLVRDRSLEGVRKELIDILPEYVQPAITVAQIMSHSPQLLAPDTPVEEAARRMQRFGYEGFPVVQGGKVIGLLTRRAVDRAQAHKLNLAAASLMDAGEHSVQPNDSIEHLQRLMTESGWGQVPVIHPATGEIVGIVTRTDLLKTLSPQPRPNRPQSMVERLEKALPPARLALLKAVAQMAHMQRAALYIVGGFVRDILLARSSEDFDLVVEGDAIALAKGLAKKYGGRVTSHTRFGTAKWLISGIQKNLLETMVQENILQDPAGLILITDLPDSLDLISARTEFYAHPTALPTVERGSIKLDLHRRDFTINTLALRLDGRHYGELHDYWGGLNDLRHGLVRGLHSLTFVDDPTRMLRAVRFEQRFGFKIEKRTLELMQEAHPLLARVSGDRIRHEIDHILAEENMHRMLARLDELNLLTTIDPSLKWDDWLCEKFQALQNGEPGPEWGLGAQALKTRRPGDPQTSKALKRDLGYILWLLRLNVVHAERIINRLKLPANLSITIISACRLWVDLPGLSGASPSQIVLRLDEVPPLALYAVFLAADRYDSRQAILSYASRWKHVKPSIDGSHLQAMGLPPGPGYRRILNTLREAWLDGKVLTPQEELALLDDLVAREGRSRHGGNN